MDNITLENRGIREERNVNLAQLICLHGAVVAHQHAQILIQAIIFYI